MKQKITKGRPQKYDFDIKVNESQQYVNGNARSIRSAAWRWSQLNKSGKWKYSVLSVTGKLNKVIVKRTK